jgi:hypothetical protein
MSIIAKDGIIQTKANESLYLIAQATMKYVLGSTRKEFISSDIASPNLFDIKCAAHANQFALNPFEYFNYLSDNTPNESYIGMLARRTLSGPTEVSDVVSVDSATDKITTSGVDASITAGKLVFLRGSQENDGIYKVSSVSAPDIFIDTGAVDPGIKNAIASDEAGLSAKVSLINPSYILWDESNTNWAMGYFNGSYARKNLGIIGYNLSEASSDFAATNPNLSAYGTTAAGAAAKAIGVNPTSITSSTETNLQDLLEDLDTAIVTSGNPDVPAFVFGEAAAIGSTNSYARIDSTLALFENSTPSSMDATVSGNKGSSGKASRHDHIHAIPTAAPSGGLAETNQVGGNATVSRSDHVHDLTVKVKSGVVALSATDTSKAVVYPSAFSTDTTSVKCQVNAKVAEVDPEFYLWRITTEDATGFTVSFSAPISTANYELTYIAYGV